jgi:rsbT co-antagonist protein RsbR
MSNALATVTEIVERRRADLKDAWVRELLREGRAAPNASAEMSRQTAEFIELFVGATAKDASGDTRGADWRSMREFLGELSRTRAQQGLTSSQTATFIFSLKKPLFAVLEQELRAEPSALVDAVWAATEILDQLGLVTVAAFQKTREELIGRQQQEMLELSTPVVKLWDGVLALPMIGTLDSARTQVVMETLLERIVETGSQVAIIDITGVPTVDTLVAQHLLKTANAIRLMGSECIVSGIRPQIAQTIVHLGVDLGDIVTKATLADALALALKRNGLVVSHSAQAQG